VRARTTTVKATTTTAKRTTTTVHVTAATEPKIVSHARGHVGRNDNAIARLARRYRVLYAVTPAKPGRAYGVTHSDSLFMFDNSGQARLVTMSTQDTAALAAEIRSLG
jgi:cytochrome oxidase Cu insertion factor (SCO1/SenC/PrrC family)